MSANAWRICPTCKRLNDEKNKKRILDAEKKYGKISADEYIKLAAEVQKPIELEETLREDYVIFLSESGLFCVSYGCSCSVCKFKYNFEHKENLKF